MVKIVSRNPK